jgi:hypothetical protein
MARRRNLKDLLTPEPTPDKQLDHPSGWCMTDSHDDCKYQFNHGKCGCDCHTKPKVVRTKPTTVASDSAPKRRGRPPKAPVVMEDDPRPWKKK